MGGIFILECIKVVWRWCRTSDGVTAMIARLVLLGLGMHIVVLGVAYHMCHPRNEASGRDSGQDIVDHQTSVKQPPSIVATGLEASRK